MLRHSSEAGFAVPSFHQRRIVAAYPPSHPLAPCIAMADAAGWHRFTHVTKFSIPSGDKLYRASVLQPPATEAGTAIKSSCRRLSNPLSAGELTVSSVSTNTNTNTNTNTDRWRRRDWPRRGRRLSACISSLGTSSRPPSRGPAQLQQAYDFSPKHE